MKSRVIRKNMIKPYEQALVQAEKSAATVEKYLRSVKAFVAAYEGQKAEKAIRQGWEKIIQRPVQMHYWRELTAFSGFGDWTNAVSNRLRYRKRFISRRKRN